jgi:hypothetical protein
VAPGIGKIGMGIAMRSGSTVAFCELTHDPCSHLIYILRLCFLVLARSAFCPGGGSAFRFPLRHPLHPATSGNAMFVDFKVAHYPFLIPIALLAAVS